jgi:hypothetical protein
VSNGLTVLEQALGASIPLKDVTTAHLEKMKLRRLEDDKVAKSTVDKIVLQLVHQSGHHGFEPGQEG